MTKSKTCVHCARSALALCFSVLFALACAVAQIPKAYADELGENFIVAAAQQDGSYVLEPTIVTYEDGDTVQQALECADLGFEFTQVGTVDSVGGIKPSAGVYLYYFTDYESQPSAMLSAVQARDIKALYVSSADVGAISQGQVDLLEQVRAFRLRSEAGEGLANFPDAKTAYNRCVQGLPSATDGQAQTLAGDLANAIADYDTIMNGPKRAITFNVKRANSAYNDAKVYMTDLYDNVTQAQRTGSGTYTAQVVDGIYSYEVLDDDGLDGVRCTMTTVTAAAQVNAEIPSDEWFGSIKLLVKSNNNAECSLDGTSVANRRTQTVRNIVPDAVQAVSDLAVYAEPASAISSSTNSYPLYVVYTGTDGQDRSEQIAYRSKTFRPPYLITTGVKGAKYTYEVRHPLDTNFLTSQVETCNASITRSATLAGISVAEGDMELLSGFATYTTSYDVYTSADELSFAPEPFGSSEEGYAATVNGQMASASSPVTVAISDAARTSPQKVEVKVALGGSAASATTYTVNVHKEDASEVVLSHASDVTVAVQNDAGAFAVPVESTATSSTYRLLKGHTYTYIATIDRYYHATCKFTAADGATVEVAQPQTTPALESFALGRDNLWGSGANAKPLFPVDERAAAEAGTDAEKLLHEPRFLVPDYWSSRLWLRAYPTAQTAETYEASYARQDTAKQLHVTFTPATTSGGVRISGALDGFTTASGYANALSFTVTTGKDGDVTYTQDYTVKVARQLTLQGVSLGSSDGATIKIMTAESADSPDPVFGFERDIRDYVAVVPAGTDEVIVQFAFSRPISSTALAQGGYTVSVDGEQFAYESGAIKSKRVSLDTTQGEQLIPVTVFHEDDLATTTTYRITVRQMPKVTVAFDVFPSDAAVTVTEVVTGLRVNPNKDGAFDLMTGYDYSYSVAARGYVGASGQFMAYDGLELNVELAVAPVNPAIDPGIGAHWPYFRADENNNAVISAKTPIPNEASASTDTSSDPLLYWATRMGSGYDSGAAGCPIIVDGYLYTYAANKIYKIDTVTGEVVATGTMTGTSSFAITPMTYAEGMVFVALSNGRVQAFNAATLESLWVYTSPNGGQPNCPISYHDGCVYTGFWNWSNVCDFVCLTVTDEDPAVADDAKVPLWTYAHEGGFYWAGAWAGDDYVIVGGDDASISSGLDSSLEDNASGPLLSLDSLTGRLIDKLTDYPGDVNVGNIRSTVVYDPQADRFYYCGRAGYLCSVAVNADGTFNHASAQAIRLENSASDGAISATSTPVIYNGRAYVGADHGAYNAYDGQSIDVVDLATGTVAYVVNVQGRAQASGLLTTGYVDDEGYVYVYYFDNYTPGKLRCFKDRPGQTRAMGVSVEQGYSNVANVVFCPQGAQAQYCICSPIADEYGTIYFKNDSAYMMAVGSPITKLEVTEQPTVTEYGVGERFNPAGMKVIATYANGATRDVTRYVQCSEDVFDKEGIVDVPVVFPHTMYQSGATGQDIGQAPDYNFEKPSTTVQVTVGTAVAPRLTTEELPIVRATDTATGTEYPYEAKLEATGAPRDFTWTLTGELPSGLSFDPATATISGTPAAKTGGEYPIDVTVSNGVGQPANAHYVLKVHERPSVAGTSREIPMRVGEPFSYQVNATGYPLPLTYALQEGYVSPQGWTSHTPEGLSIDPETGLISGTPTEAGQFRMRVFVGNEVGNSIPYNFRVAVSDAVQITTTSLPTGVVGLEYLDGGEQVVLQAQGYPAPTWSWEAAAGSQLPEGLVLDEATGAITGAPTTAGSYDVIVRAQNSEGAAEQAFTLEVSASATAPGLVTTELPYAAIDEPYNVPIKVSGAPSPKVTMSGLPDGLMYDPKTHAIVGTPTSVGTYEVQVSTSNTEGTRLDTLVLVVAVAPQIGNEVLGHATEEAETGFVVVGEEVSLLVQVSGSPIPEVEVSGLPAGLTYNESTGCIEGMPTAVYEAGSTVKVTADNGVGPAVERTYTLCVYEAPSVGEADWQMARFDQTYVQDLGISGTPAPKVVITGLASGLHYDKAKGVIAGTPTMKGTFNVTLQASNAVGSVKVVKQLVVGSPPTIGVYALSDAVEGQAYAMPLKVSGEPAPDVQVNGLPEGLSYDEADGVIAGTTSAIGQHTVTVTASNGISPDAERTFTLVVREDFTLDTDDLPPAYTATDEAYQVEIPFTGEVDAESVEVTGLPQGITYEVVGNTLSLSGTTTAEAGVYECSVSAKSARGTVLNTTFTIVVEPYEKAASFGVSEYALMPWTKGVNGTTDLASALQASGRPGNFAFSVAQGSALPEGLALSEAGVLSGAPEMGGSYTFAVQCTNGVGAPATALVSLDVGGAPDAQVVSVPQGFVGSAYSTTISLGGYPTPTYSWQAAAGSSLVPGLSLDSGTGVVKGTPSRPGIYNVVITAANNSGSQDVHVSFVIKADISGAKIASIAAQQYTGKALKPHVTVYEPDFATSVSGTSSGLVAGSLSKQLAEGVDYQLVYDKNIDAGKATVTVKGAGVYVGSKTCTFDINKAEQPLTAKAAKKSFKVKYSKVKKKKQLIKTAVKVSGAKGAVTYAKVKVSKKKMAKKFVVNKKNGKITVKKGVKKGTYKVTVKVSAAATKNYNPATKNVVVKVVVK